MGAMSMTLSVPAKERAGLADLQVGDKVTATLQSR